MQVLGHLARLIIASGIGVGLSLLLVHLIGDRLDPQYHQKQKERPPRSEVRALACPSTRTRQTSRYFQVPVTPF